MMRMSPGLISTLADTSPRLIRSRKRTVYCLFPSDVRRIVARLPSAKSVSPPTAIITSSIDIFTRYGNAWGRFGWIASFFYAVCAALRLARFNARAASADKRYFEGLGIEANVRHSHGATEAKVPDIADAIVELTETGSAIRAAGLRIIDTILTSYTELIANRAAFENPAKRHAMGQIHTLLQGTLEARGKVLLKLNVSNEDFERVVATS